MASSCCVVIDFSTFYNCWKFLKKNYSDKMHNDADAKFYFACFKDVKKDDFLQAIKEVLKYCSYFPRVDEIQRYLPGEFLKVRKSRPELDTETLAKIQAISDFDWLDENTTQN